MKRASASAILALWLVTTAAHAYEGSDGLVYEITCDKAGYVLTPDKGQPLYLETTCNAYQWPHGSGTWGWANGGFWADLQDGRVAFGRQELFCRDADPPPFEAGCRQ